MERSKIEYCDYTWNPVTGCRHGCQYCYAAKMAKRFCGDIRYNKAVAAYEEHDGLYIIENEIKARNGRALSFPFGFAPTLHKNRLTKNCKPMIISQPFNIFVCSISDLWGEWVPDEWIDNVMKVCIYDAPRHNYLFLTKNPLRYVEVLPKRYGECNIDNLWFGVTITDSVEPAEIISQLPDYINTYLSIEPIHAPIVLKDTILEKVQWVIIGAETGQRNNKIVPQKDWIKNIINQCSKADIPVFLKNNLSSIWDDDLTQELPKRLEGRNRS